MKTIYFLILFALCLPAFAQDIRPAKNKIIRTKTSKSNINRKTTNDRINDTAQVAQPRESITERYLKGPSRLKTSADTTSAKSTNTKSQFARGIHPAANAGERFDSATRNINVNNETADNAIARPAAPNDTIFNANTITDNSVHTNSGAVDRSGRAQFGQSNWGNSRSTVGESQWTVPPPVTASFTKEFPSVGNLIWTRNNSDTSIYSARYKSGDSWITTNYSVSGQRLDTRTEVPLTLLPQPVNTYISKLPNDLQVSKVSKWEVLGKPDVYEIQTRTGKTMYVSSEGAEVAR